MKNKFLLLILIQVVLAQVTFSQTPIYYQNYPLELDGNREPFRKAGIPLITDLDKDGQKEIITFALDYYGMINPLCMLHIIRSDGSSYPNFPKGYDELILDIASGDVNGDGFLDIALRFTHSFDVIDRFGNHLSGFPVNYSDGDINPTNFISLYDLDNDNKLEIIINRTGDISVFNFNGTLRSGWPRSISGRASYNPAIGDIDNDGFAEIVLSSFKFINNIVDSGAVHIFRHNGLEYSNNFPIYFDSAYFSWSSSPSLFINKNNSDSTFFLVPLDKNSLSSERLHKFVKIGIHGVILEKKYYFDLMDYGTLVMGDLNTDGKLDFSSGTQYGISLSAFDNNLNRIEGWPASGNGEHYATSVIAKISNFGSMNIISNTWSAESVNGNGYIYAYTNNGVNLPWSPLRPYGLVKGISASDLNNDGSVELIATATQQRKFYLHVWTMPGVQFTHENFPWPQYGHDRYRTNQYGFVPPDEPVGIQPISSIVPEKFSLNQNFPNPFNPTTSIKFEIKNSSITELKIFDALGREVETLINERLKPGTYSLTFEGSKFTSGVYFYRLTADDFVETKKMLLVK